ncbi:MAG TPA: phosphatase PAP2-related protein [Ignavibacteria bacterium]
MDFKTSWKNFSSKKTNISSLIIAVISVVITLSLFSRFILLVEERKGVSFIDPLLTFFNAIDLNIFIFSLIYISLISGLIYLSGHPRDLLIALVAYIILVWVRMLMMYVLPLDPPPGTINLQDPIVFLIGTGKPVTRDLFFSGHTSTLFLIFLCVKNKTLKPIFLAATVFVGIAVMLQKAHYSVDVFAAPFISYAAYKISEKISGKISPAAF